MKMNLRKLIPVIFDSMSSVAFWTPMLGTVSLLILGVPPAQVVGIMLTSLVMNMALGGPYGKFLNIWRRKFKNIAYKDFEKVQNKPDV